MTSLRQRVLNALQHRNCSPATTRGYILAIKQFAEYFHKSPEQLNSPTIRWINQNEQLPDTGAWIIGLAAASPVAMQEFHPPIDCPLIGAPACRHSA